MVVRACPMCRGVGHLQVGVVPKPGPHLVQVDVASVLDDIKSGLGLRKVAKHHRISIETARVIGNGSWAGYKRSRD